LRVAAERIEDGKERGGIVGLVQRARGMAGAGLQFARLYFHRAGRNELPQSVRMQPAW
jgi:magnesium-protoporphyrin IX monomethyl ester (oxidative) cyclase